MTFITVATIGYGEVVDLTHHPFGRLFTVGIATVGIATVSYLSPPLWPILVDADLNAERKRIRMEKQMAELRGHYIMCGIGRVAPTWRASCPNPAQVRRDRKRPRSAGRLVGTPSARPCTCTRMPPTMTPCARLGFDPCRRRVCSDRRRWTQPDDCAVRQTVSTPWAARSGAGARCAQHRQGPPRRCRRNVSPDFTGGMRIASAMVRPHVVSFMTRCCTATKACASKKWWCRATSPLVPLG